MIMPDGRRLEAAAGNNYLTTMVISSGKRVLLGNGRSRLRDRTPVRVADSL